MVGDVTVLLEKGENEAIVCDLADVLGVTSVSPAVCSDVCFGDEAFLTGPELVDNIVFDESKNTEVAGVASVLSAALVVVPEKAGVFLLFVFVENSAVDSSTEVGSLAVELIGGITVAATFVEFCTSPSKDIAVDCAVIGIKDDVLVSIKAAVMGTDLVRVETTAGLEVELYSVIDDGIIGPTVFTLVPLGDKVFVTEMTVFFSVITSDLGEVDTGIKVVVI